MHEIDARLRAVCDLMVAEVREGAGLHEYDGTVQDLSPAGVRAGLAPLGAGARRGDPHDEAHLACFEEALRVALGELELHRRDPGLHIGNLDLACYDRDYAPADERRAARTRHLARWPDAVDMAVTALDRVSAPVARALLPSARGLVATVSSAEGDEAAQAVLAHGRLVAHLEAAAEHGDPDPALGGPALARLLGAGEGLEVDLGRLSETAARETRRLRDALEQACARLDPGRPVPEVVAALLGDHPGVQGVLTEARQVTEEVVAFTRERDLAPYVDGECLVGPAPESRSWAMAMMAWAAPQEPDAPSWYWVTPPDPTWPLDEIEEWLSVFNRAALPAITVHEVAPGHFAHGRSLRRAATPERRILHSTTFAEGWAHYAEEVCVEEGFRDGDAAFAVGVCLEALIRVTRLTVSLGLHTGGMSVEEAAELFAADALMGRRAAVAEAERGTFDATYGRYTWGKLALLDLRTAARERWGAGFSLSRFHRALLDLGSPPLGLLGTALERG